MAEKPSMVIDEALSGPRPHWCDRKLYESLQAQRYRAHRFVFSGDASAIAGRLAIECGDLVLNNRQFAIPPYNEMYVEIDSRRFYECTDRLFGPRETSDTRVGYLIVNRQVYTVVDGPNGPAALSPLTYQVVPPGQKADGDDRFLLITSDPITAPTDEMADWRKLALVLGTGFEKLQSEEQRLQILDEVRVQWKAEISPKSIDDFLMGNSGDVRNLWTLLLWLNQPTKVHYEDRPAGHRLIRGKRVSYMQSRVVEIELGKVKVLRKALDFPIERESPINHPVRGEFHHRGGRPDCAHEWPLLPEEFTAHWHCTKCNRLRYWVKEHRRGDATKGFSDSPQYAVKA